MCARPILKTLDPRELSNKVCVVVGTRPGIIMMSPLIRALQRAGTEFLLLHTGQHYSYTMDRRFLEELQLPEPGYRIDAVHECRFHGEQTAAMLAGCEQAFLRHRPKLVVVGGDANTNLAAALAGRKLHLSVAHIEAGERSGDWRMPEEHNRVIIDHISDYLFATGEKARANLLQGCVRGKIFVTGNPIVDACYQNLELARQRDTLRRFSLDPGRYSLLTLHREENADSEQCLAGVLEALRLLWEEFGLPIFFAVHPRTRRRLEEFGMLPRAHSIEGLRLEQPVGYLDFLNLVSGAALVLTDSGGVQQEACILRSPCVTLRDSTEWVETLQLGANMLVGVRPEAILQGARRMMGEDRIWEVLFGDGRSAERIVAILQQEVLS